MSHATQLNTISSKHPCHQTNFGLLARADPKNPRYFCLTSRIASKHRGHLENNKKPKQIRPIYL